MKLHSYEHKLHEIAFDMSISISKGKNATENTKNERRKNSNKRKLLFLNYLLKIEKKLKNKFAGSGFYSNNLATIMDFLCKNQQLI